MRKIVSTILTDTPRDLVGANLYNVLVISLFDMSLRTELPLICMVFNVRSFSDQYPIRPHSTYPHTLVSLLHCGNVLMKLIVKFIADVTKICYKNPDGNARNVFLVASIR